MIRASAPAVMRSLKAARTLWLESAGEERQWWVVALVAAMALVGGLAGAGPNPEIPLGSLFKSAHPHVELDRTSNESVQPNQLGAVKPAPIH